MNHLQRVACYRQYMAGQGVSMNAAVPPLWKIIWASGLEVPPPPFLGPVVLGLYGALSLVALTWILWLLFIIRGLFSILPDYAFPWLWNVYLSAIFGLFGLVAMPPYYRQMARRCGLYRWATFSGYRQRA